MGKSVSCNRLKARPPLFVESRPRRTDTGQAGELIERGGKRTSVGSVVSCPRRAYAVQLQRRNGTSVETSRLIKVAENQRCSERRASQTELLSGSAQSESTASKTHRNDLATCLYRAMQRKMNLWLHLRRRGTASTSNGVLRVAGGGGRQAMRGPPMGGHFREREEGCFDERE